MNDRAWQHPWLRVQRLIRSILEVRRDPIARPVRSPGPVADATTPASAPRALVSPHELSTQRSLEPPCSRTSAFMNSPG